MRRLDIGVASYRAPEKLRRTLRDIEDRSATDWRCFVIHNPAPDDGNTRQVIEEAYARNRRFVPVSLPVNVGYAGAVNVLFQKAETEYIAYLDNDVQIQTSMWDEVLCDLLDKFHEVGWVFPNSGPYALGRGNYQEVMWGVGFAWVLNRVCMATVGLFDEALGHQEEADYALRVRMAGYRCAALPQVSISHDATASNDPASIERISRGVINWVNKWTRYFGGVNLNYHSGNVLRWEDWPPNALYLEDWWQGRLPGLNANPEVVNIDGREYDLIRVPRFKGFYRNRVI